jgi:hypothetical protein
MPSLPSLPLDPLIAIAVVFATACTDAIYVLFTNAVVKRRQFPAAAWSSVWYMLGSFAVITYTPHRLLDRPVKPGDDKVVVEGCNFIDALPLRYLSASATGGACSG